jgi:hypothetical protein
MSLNDTFARINLLFVRLEIFTAVTMKKGVFLDVNAVWLL